MPDFDQCHAQEKDQAVDGIDHEGHGSEIDRPNLLPIDEGILYVSAHRRLFNAMGRNKQGRLRIEYD